LPPPPPPSTLFPYTTLFRSAASSFSASTVSASPRSRTARRRILHLLRALIFLIRHRPANSRLDWRRCTQCLSHVSRLSLTRVPLDRKSTRLNSSHLGISYAV